jgi:hypothetical protein
VLGEKPATVCIGQSSPAKSFAVDGKKCHAPAFFLIFATFAITRATVASVCSISRSMSSIWACCSRSFIGPATYAAPVASGRH